MLNLEGIAPQPARTLDVGSDGVCLVLANPLHPGTVATVRFEIFHDGKATPVTARSKVTYCILGHDGFKVGFQFVNLELSAMAALSKFLH